MPRCGLFLRHQMLSVRYEHNLLHRLLDKPHNSHLGRNCFLEFQVNIIIIFFFICQRRSKGANYVQLLAAVCLSLKREKKLIFSLYTRESIFSFSISSHNRYIIVNILFCQYLSLIANNLQLP